MTIFEGVGAFLAVFAGLLAAVRVGLREHRVVRCPGTGGLVVVEVDRRPAAPRVHACTTGPHAPTATVHAFAAT